MAEIDPLIKIGFQEGLTHHLQQKKSKLEATVRMVNQTGIETAVDRIGKAEPVKRTKKYAQTPILGVGFDRRWIMSDIYDWGDIIDDDDKLKTMQDPTSEMSQAAQMGMQRQKDRVIIDSWFARVPAGQKSTDGFVDHPTDRILPAENTGLTFAKINLAREMLDEAEVPDEDPRYMVVTAQQISNMLDEPKATSADYVTIGAIQSGKFEGTYMGFHWITIGAKMLKKNGVIRRCGAYTKSSLAICKPAEISTKIDQRPDLSYATQVFATMRIGAARTEEAGVIGIDCQERA